MLPGAIKDKQQISEDWHKLGDAIDGVSVREVRHVPRDHGMITEIFRPEWDPTGMPVVPITAVYRSAWRLELSRPHHGPALRQPGAGKGRAL